MNKKVTLIYDLDETLCTKKQSHETYADVKPIQPMINQLNRLYDEGYEIIINSARNMVTQNNDESKVLANVGLVTLQWLEKHGVKYHGIKFGKTYGALYIDDKACLADISEVERRLEAIKNGTEKEYIKEHLNLHNKTKELEKEVMNLRAELQFMSYELNNLRNELGKNGR